MEIIKANITQLVEYLLGKEEVIGSNPIISSNTFMLIVLLIFQLCNLADMVLTIEFIFETNRFLEGNPIIANTGLVGLYITKYTAAIFGFVLYFIGKFSKVDGWKANIALVFSAITYSLLVSWWGFVLST